MYSSNFDPLQAKYSGTEEVVIKSLKREIKNILSSYVGWFDPFCELNQLPRCKHSSTVSGSYVASHST